MKGALKRFLIFILILVVIFGGIAIFVVVKTGVLTDKTYNYVSYEYVRYGNYTEAQLATGIGDDLDAIVTNAEKSRGSVVDVLQKIKVVTNSKTLKCTSGDGTVRSYSYSERDDGNLSFSVSGATTSTTPGGSMYYSSNSVTIYYIDYTDTGIDLRVSAGSKTYTFKDTTESVTAGVNLVLHYNVA